MKKLLLLGLALLGTIELNARGWGWGGGPYYGYYAGPGYYRGGLFSDIAAVGLTAAALSDNEKSPEYYDYKDKESQRREIKKQIARAEKDLRKNPGDKELKNELKQLRIDLRSV